MMESGLRSRLTPGVYGLTPPSQGAPTPLRQTNPGAFNLNLVDPVGTAVQNQKESDDFINGLGQALFGKDNESIFGGIPLLGDVVRGVSEVPGVGIPAAAVGSALGLGVGAVTEVAKRIPTGWLPGIGSDQVFESLPHTPEWEAVKAAAEADVLAGGNLKFDYAQKYFEDIQGSIKESSGLTTFSPGLMAGAGGSFGGMIGQALGLFQLPQRAAERAIAGTAKILSGMNRVQETMARAASGEELSPVEQAVVQHIADGSWTEQRALDFMASHGSGLSHNQVLQLVGSFATDPTVVASLGTAGLARLGISGGQMAAQGVRATTFADRLASGVYSAQSAEMGRIFKIGRTIVDPLSAIGGKSIEQKAMLDLFSRDVGVRGFLAAHVTDLGQNVFRETGNLGMDADKVLKAAASRGQTYTRYILAEMKQAELVRVQRSPDAFDMNETIEAMMRRAPRDIERRVEELVHNHRRFLWDDASKSELGQQLARTFGGDADAVSAWVARQNDGDLGLLHDLLYAGEEGEFRQLLQGIEEVPGGDAAVQYTGDIPLNRLNMFDHTTLTDLGAAGFIKNIGNLDVESDEAKAILRELQSNFPATRRYGNNVQFALDDLSRRLAAGRDGDLPHQVTRAEMQQMPKALQDWFAEHPHRTLGFRPADGVLWNIDRNPITGKLEVQGEPWVEHVFPDSAYRPGEELPFNIAGQVVKVTSPVKQLDWLVAGPRLLSKRISGTLIRQQAEQNFIKSALRNNGDVIDEPTARAAFNALTEHLDTTQNPTVTSLRVHELFRVASQVLPPRHDLTERDVLRWVVEGFEGDLSKVGLGQKIPNKLRTWLTMATGSNAWYEISQEVYGQLKFRGPLAIRFKTQEVIEPHVLNAIEGTPSDVLHPQLPPPLVEEVDRIISRLSETSFLRLKDQTDLLEQSAYLKRVATVREKAGLPETRLQRILNPDIQKQKRIAQTRMLGVRLGSAVREAFKADGREAEFDLLKNAYADATGATAHGRVVSDSEYAIHWLNGIGGEIVDASGNRLRIEDLLEEANRWSPSDVGEVKRIGLDATAALLNGLKGHTINNLQDLYNAMKPSRDVAQGSLIQPHDIREALTPLASKEFVDRFLTAFNFDWGGFWSRAADKFGMTADETKRLQSWVADIARTQGMEPVEFLSQVVSSGIRKTWKPKEIEANLAKGLAVLRAGKGAKPEQLIQQLSEAFVGHLHPSGRAALIRAMQKDAGMAVDLAAESLPPAVPGMRDRDAGQAFQIISPFEGEPPLDVVGPLGEGFFDLPTELQDKIANEIDRLQNLTGVTIDHLDVDEAGEIVGDDFGEAFATGNGGSAILLGPKALLDQEAKNWAAATKTHFPETEFGLGNIERRSNMGAPAYVSATPEGHIRHEFAHALVDFIERKGNRRKYAAIRKFLDRFEESPAARQTSEYAMSKRSESDAEIIALALDPDVDLTKFRSVPRRGIDPEVGARIERLNKAEQEARAAGDIDEADRLAQEMADLQRSAMDAPGAIPGFGVPPEELRDVPPEFRPGGVAGAPQTTEEAVEELRRLMAEAGLIKEPPPAFTEEMLTEDFARRLMERAASGVPSDDPVLENAFRYFGDWSKLTLQETALGSGDESIARLLQGLPQDGRAFDHTEGALLEQVFNRIGQLENETYRLQFFSRDRSLLERSINHPMFALYPASYMWFKIMPQMVKFIAQRPFGLKTGALAYSLLDVQKDIAIQREYDPEFSAMLDEASNNPLVWFLSYMVPATPWDIPTLWPAWMRELAGQGLANAQRAASNRPTKGLDVSRIATKAFAPLDPMASLKLGLDTSAALGDILTGSEQEQRQRPGRVGLTSQIAPAVQQLAEPLAEATEQLSEALGGGG